PAPLPAPAEATGRHWLVFGDRSALTAAIGQQVAATGAQLTLVRRDAQFAREADGSFCVEPGNAEHLHGLLGGLEQAGSLPDRVLYLWPLETEAGCAGTALAGQPLAFDGLLALARTVQELDWQQALQLCAVTSGAQAVGGEPVPHPDRALALGPCRVIPRELPQVGTRLIDLSETQLQDAQATAALLLAEAGAPGGADLVAWRDGKRWGQKLVALPAGDAPAPQAGLERLRRRGVYLITGGLGEIALDLAEYLATSHQARIALLSRRALPPHAQWASLAQGQGSDPEQARLLRRLLAIEAAGASVLTLQADAADRAAMTAAIAICRMRWGGLHGVFHAAGVMDDGPIASRQREAVQSVLRPKALAAQLLHELLPPGSLDLFALFSSTSVYLGPPGQVDYVAANAFLDALAASRPDGLAIHWGIWGDKGMAARAYHRQGSEPEAGRVLHPLLGQPAPAEAGAAFEARYDPKELWVLNEHTVAGQPVLPGTAYIEIARAALAQLHPACAVEIRALSFEEAMVFADGAPRQVRVELRPAGEGYDFTVRSREAGAERWVEHARAGLRVFQGHLQPAPALPAADWAPGRLPQGGVLHFGARWHNIERMRLRQREATAELALAPSFHGDAADYACHPALLDMAATFGLHLLGQPALDQSLFVPISVQRIVLAAPLGPRLISRVERKGADQERFAAFDVQLHAPDGTPLALLEGFSLRGIDPGAMHQPPRGGPRRAAPLAETLLACGIRSEDAPALFARILASGQRELVVSSIDLQSIARAMQPARVPARAAAPAEGAVQAAGAMHAKERLAL
ncbi:MAG TPA: KR domain-containing protein, partial [Ramlibacter sp.]|nr:KR domain-containing protein [Ramlibacter sp.]